MFYGNLLGQPSFCSCEYVCNLYKYNKVHAHWKVGIARHYLHNCLYMCKKKGAGYADIDTHLVHSLATSIKYICATEGCENLFRFKK